MTVTVTVNLGVTVTVSVTVTVTVTVRYVTFFFDRNGNEYRQLSRSQGSTLQILKVEPLFICAYPEGGYAYRDHNAGRKTTLANLEVRTFKILKVEPWR